MDLKTFIHKVPKAELHVHLFGTLTWPRTLYVAQRNNLPVQQRFPEYTGLNNFISEYDNGVSVFRTSRDFYEILCDYLDRCFEQNILYTEIIIDPQSHGPFGVTIDTMMEGLLKAQEEYKYQVKCNFILCFVRHLGLVSTQNTLNKVKPYLNHFIGIGLGGIEKDYPLSMFTDIYKQAKILGLKLSAHCGEGTGNNYIQEAIELGIDRIDHGIDCSLSQIKILKEKQIPLTLCPVSNIKIGLYKELKDHPIFKFYREGLLISLNSDDPDYFNSYLEDVYNQVAEAFNLNIFDIVQLAKMSFTSSWLPYNLKQHYIGLIDKLYETQS